MDIQSCIYWFSGTGNSLYAARRLASELGGIPLVQMTGDPPTDAIGGDGARIGFVFPSYYGNLPRAVRAFVERLEIRPGTFIFTVVTMGAVGQGSVAALDKALKAKGLRLSYGRGIHMPANYVVNYDPADPDKSEKSLSNADKRLSSFAAEITAGTLSVKTLPITAKSLYNDIEKLDAGFTASDKCTGCRLCERICPVKNIQLENGKPEWLHRCERCVACISWCPVKAIDYGEHTQSRRRYCNPHVKAEDLTRRKETQNDKAGTD